MITDDRSHSSDDNDQEGENLVGDDEEEDQQEDLGKMSRPELLKKITEIWVQKK